MLLRNLNVLNRIYKDEFLVFFSIPAISLTLILTNLYSAEPMFTSSNDKFSINICKKLTNAGNCTEIAPEQPTKLEMKFIGKIPQFRILITHCSSHLKFIHRIKPNI